LFGLSETRFAILLLLPALVLFTLVILYPLVNSLYLGLTDRSLIYPGGGFVGLRNVRAVLGDEFLPMLVNTLTFTVGATVLPFVIGFALALVLNTGIRGQGLLRGAFLFPWLVPGVVVSFLWLWIFDANYGVLNGALRVAGLVQDNVNWLGSGTLAMAAVVIAKTWNSFPWMTVMLLAALQTVPRDLYEAAALDGAGRWQTFRRVTIPQLRGIIFIVLLLEVIWNFQQFEIIYVMTGGGPAGATTTFSVALYQEAFEAFDLGRAGAIGILWMALLSILVFVYVRYGEREEAG
jgi:multiple sugar transport system permease protein